MMTDNMDTSNPNLTPSDPEDVARAGQPSRRVSMGAWIMIALFVAFFVVIFLFTFLFVYNNNKENGLQAQFPAVTATPAVGTGGERIVVANIKAVPTVISEKVKLMATPTPPPTVANQPTPATKPPTPEPMEIEVTNYYTGASLTLTVKDDPSLLPTPVGNAKDATQVPVGAVTSATVKFLFYNKDGRVGGNWVDNVGPIPLGSSKDFTINIPTKPGLGNWDGTPDVRAVVYAVLVEAKLEPQKSR